MIDDAKLVAAWESLSYAECEAVQALAYLPQMIVGRRWKNLSDEERSSVLAAFCRVARLGARCALVVVPEV